MMENRRGVFIVIEGTDGSGKGTQFALLSDALGKQGYDVETFDFPQYDEPSSYFVKRYLNGDYGTLEQIGPYTASLFYALDRFEAAPRIREALAQGKVVLANRFTGSSMAHQGTKFQNPEERRGFFIWLDNLEFEMLHIPRPDISFILRVPADIAQKLVDQKEQRGYTDKKRDLHEADLTHLERSVAVFDDMAQLFPKDFKRIDCVRGDQLMPIEAVEALVRQNVEPYLPSAPPVPPPIVAAPSPAAVTPTPAVAEPAPQASAETPVVAQDQSGNYKITESGRDRLAKAVTSLDSDIFAFTNHLSPAEIAAAMVHASRHKDDVRTALLEQPVSEHNKEALQRLTGMHVVVEHASSLLAEKLSQGNRATYIESSAYHFDEKEEQGSYPYYTPDSLSPAVVSQYRERMDAIFDRYASMAQALTAYITEIETAPTDKTPRARAIDTLQVVLPVATTTSMGMFASAHALEELITRLLSDDLPEARTASQEILAHARTIIPTILSDEPEPYAPAVAYRTSTRAALGQVVKKYLPDFHSQAEEPARLQEVWPRNEIDLLPAMLYEHSNLSLRDLKNEVATWPYDRKLEAFDAYTGNREQAGFIPGPALEKAHYSWDLMSDYATFRDIERRYLTTSPERQALTPRYGYQTPKLIEDAGLTDQFLECFDISLELYSLLQANDYHLEAQYATLLGHTMRWSITHNACEAFDLRELSANPASHAGTQALIQAMLERLSQVHPIIGEAVQSVQ